MTDGRSFLVAFVSLWLVSMTMGAAGAAESKPAVDAKADQLLRGMGGLLARTHTLSFRTSEVFERTRRTGERTTVRYSRDVVLRRPDGLWLRVQGDDRDGMLWYDGKTLSVQANRQKAWAQAAVPETLDRVIDYVGERLAVPMPVADILYSSPYHALVGSETRGGYRELTRIDGVACHQLAFQDEAVDWQICVDEGPRPLPRRLEIVYKTDPGQPRIVVTFRDWNLAPKVAASTFAFKPPEGFERVRLVQLVPGGDRSAPGGASETKP